MLHDYTEYLKFLNTTGVLIREEGAEICLNINKWGKEVFNEERIFILNSM